MKRVFWCSPHRPLPKQERELDRYFGEKVRLIRGDKPTYADAREIVSTALAFRCEDIAVPGLPLSMIDHLARIWDHPLWSEMVPVSPVGRRDPDCEVDVRTRRTDQRLRFMRWRPVKKVIIVFADE